MELFENRIPAGPGDFTRGWLTRALEAAGIARAASVIGVDAEVIGADRGFTGVVARLNIAYNRPVPGAPATVVAKFPLAEPDGSSYREAQQATSEQRQRYWERCAREVRFYQERADDHGFIPRTYGAWVDPCSQRMLLLLEDLSDGEPGDALAGCSVEQAERVIARLARFHARAWGSTHYPELGWLPRWGKDAASRAERFRQQLEPVLGRYRSRIPAAVADVARTCAARYELMLQALAERPATIIHGDLHLDNLIFTDDGVMLLDWQSVSVGPAITDLSLFLVGSLSVDDRRAAERDLLARYHQALTTHGVSGYQFDDLVGDYHRSLVWQLAGIVGWLARVDLASLEGRERALVEALFTPGQVFAACVDHAGDLVRLVD